MVANHQDQVCQLAVRSGNKGSHADSYSYFPPYTVSLQ